jgi:hypothetical protein
MGKSETPQERRTRERESRKQDEINAPRDDASAIVSKHSVVSLVLACVSGMVIAFVGVKLLKPETKLPVRADDHTAAQHRVTLRNNSHGTTYADLLTLDPKDVGGTDIAELNLICGSGLPGTETADTGQMLRSLDEMAEIVKTDTVNPANLERWKSNRPPNETSESIFKMRILVAAFQQKCGIHYDAELAALTTANGGKPAVSYRVWDKRFHSDASMVFLHGLLSSGRQGTCVSMPVIYTAVARRLGYPVFLVMSKGHLFCRWDSPQERFNIEGTGGGGMTPNPDEFYHTFPSRLSEWELEHENYLKSLTPAEELALFLKTRAVCLAQHDRHDEGLVALAQAVRLAGKRGIPGLAKQIARGGFLPAGTRREVEDSIIHQVKPFSGVPVGVNSAPGK